MSYNTETFKNFLTKAGISYSENVSLKTKTWIKRGGVAKLWIEPLSANDLERVCTYLYESDIFFEIIGHTSNMYFLNTYNPEIVISTKKLVHYDILENEIICECGVSISKLSAELVKQGIKGFEGFISLPGTVGGAAVNNSGCYGSILSSVILRADILLSSGEVKNCRKEELGYTHRSSFLKTKQLKGTLIRLYFKKEYGDKEILIDKADKNRKARKENQEAPDGNLGSVFANMALKKDFIFFILRIIRNILKPFVKREKRRKISNILLFKLKHKEMLLPYVSPKNYNCYLWRDEKADDYFFEYLKFIKDISVNATVEIEIRTDGMKINNNSTYENTLGLGGTETLLLDV